MFARDQVIQLVLSLSLRAGAPIKGTGSYVLVGEATSETKAFSSACHGAGRALSSRAALKQWSGRKIVDDLASQGILVRSPSTRSVAEEGPGAVGAVVAAAELAGLARRVARPRPLICIKGYSRIKLES